MSADKSCLCRSVLFGLLLFKFKLIRWQRSQSIVGGRGHTPAQGSWVRTATGLPSPLWCAALACIRGITDVCIYVIYFNAEPYNLSPQNFPHFFFVIGKLSDILNLWLPCSLNCLGAQFHTQNTQLQMAIPQYMCAILNSKQKKLVQKWWPEGHTAGQSAAAGSGGPASRRCSSAQGGGRAAVWRTAIPSRYEQSPGAPGQRGWSLCQA